MFATVYGPLLVLLSIVLGVPAFLIWKYCKNGKLGAKPVGISILYVIAAPVIMEITSIGLLMILYRIYGQS
jgi:hypothetical protein